MLISGRLAMTSLSAKFRIGEPLRSAFAGDPYCDGTSHCEGDTASHRDRLSFREPISGANVDSPGQKGTPEKTGLYFRESSR